MFKCLQYGACYISLGLVFRCEFNCDVHFAIGLTYYGNHMIAIHLHSTLILPSVGSTILTLNQLNEHLLFTSRSNQHTSTQSLLIHISLESLTSSNLISQMCGLHAKARLYPVLCRVQNGVLVFPRPANFHLREKTFSPYVMCIETRLCTMTYSLSRNYSPGLNA